MAHRDCHDIIQLKLTCVDMTILSPIIMADDTEDGKLDNRYGV
jgi:hypothetical protein